jgi:DNA-binding XRE family transcriptional regulator
MQFEDLSMEANEERAQRAAEWRRFRQTYLFSQSDLADALGVSRRTIVAVEIGETLRPHPGTLRAFRDLKKRHQRRAA